MTHGSLFSGIGGFDLAAEWMGWTNVFHCEWNPFGQKVLKHYWPDAELFTDITKSNFTKYAGAIDIISGGFPCQPYSAAGKRKGKEDERHLWPYMLDTIKSVRPRWVVGENVLGLVNWSNGLVFHEVQADLEAAGYEVWPYVLAAASVGAPHRRDRVWFVAYRNLHGFNQRNSKHEEQSSERGFDAFGHTIKGDGDGDVTDTDISTAGASGASGGAESGRRSDDVQQSKRGEQTQQHNRPSSFSRDAADTNGIRGGEDERFGYRKSNVVDEIGKKRNATDTGNEGLQRGEVIGGIGGIGQNGNKFPSGCIPPNWDIFPTQSPVRGRDDGIPNRLDGITFPKWRNESIKAYGNAVVPQVVYQIFKAIQEYETI
jgi:DNA (cytosine-5)-methyltransferase 1